MSVRKFCVGTLAALFLSSAAQAAVVSVTGDGIIIPPPASVDNNAPFDDNNIQAFDERQNVLLAADLNVDGGGVIAAGKRVASHMVFFNQEFEGSGDRFADAVFTFSQKILGVISSRDGLVSTNALLGAPGTTYGLDFNHAGIEKTDSYLVVNNDYSISLKIDIPGDWTRVITAAVPVPAAGLLLPAALGLLAFGRRRRKAA